MTEAPTLTYYAEGDHALDHYVFRTIGLILGVRMAPSKDPSAADFCYARQKPENARLFIGKSNPTVNSETVWNTLTTVEVTDDGTIENDLIHVLGQLLTDQVYANVDESEYDEFERLQYKDALQSRYSNPALPVINRCLNTLKRIFEKRFQLKGIPLWPDGKRACFILSHDVDDPDKYTLLKNYKLATPHNLDSSFLAYNKHMLRNRVWYTRDKNRDENWLFRNIMEAEGKHGFSSTFFFASRPFFDKKADPRDVPYNIEKNNFREVFRELNTSGFEVGLHASYNAYQEADMFQEERSKLEDLAKSDVLGLRHHYWHMGTDIFRTLKHHHTAGFRYDTSVAFNDDPGYRFDIALPFYPFDHRNGEEIATLQLPSFLMDGSLFYKEGVTVEEAFNKAKPYIDAVITEGGLGTFDWHVRTSFPGTNSYHSWGEGYLRILEYLAEQEGLWVTNARDVLRWWDQRAEPLKV